MVAVGAPVPTSTTEAAGLKVIVLLAVFVASSTLVTVTVTLDAAAMGEGAVNEFVEVPLASGPAGGPLVAPASVGVKLQVTAAVVVVPVTTAFRLAVCPSDRVLGTALNVTITAP
jgi:hypothetical protein